MGQEYNLPSGLAGCEWYNRVSKCGSVRIPSKASDRNKALKEALIELYKMQQKIADLERAPTPPGPRPIEGSRPK